MDDYEGWMTHIESHIHEAFHFPVEDGNVGSAPDTQMKAICNVESEVYIGFT